MNIPSAGNIVLMVKELVSVFMKLDFLGWGGGAREDTINK